MSELDRYRDSESKGWCFGHWVASHAEVNEYPDYPTDEQERLIEILFRLKALFCPCKTCGNHFKEYMDQNPIRTKNRLQLKQWLVEAQNDVNRRCQHDPLPFEQAETIQAWNRSIKWGLVSDDLRSGKLAYTGNNNNKSISKLWFLGSIVFLVGLICYLFFWTILNHHDDNNNNNNSFSKKFNPLNHIHRMNHMNQANVLQPKDIGNSADMQDMHLYERKFVYA